MDRDHGSFVADPNVEMTPRDQCILDELCESWKVYKNSRNGSKVRVTKSSVSNLWDWFLNELNKSQHNLEPEHQRRLYRQFKRKLAGKQVPKWNYSECRSRNNSMDTRKDISSDFNDESLKGHDVDPGINSQYLRILSAAGICIEDADEIVIMKLMRCIVNQCNILNLSRDLKMVKFKIQLLLFNDHTIIRNDMFSRFLKDVSDSSIMNIYSHDRAYVITMSVDSMKAISEEKLEAALQFQQNIDVNQLVTFILKDFSGTRDTDASRRRRIVLYMFHTLYCVLYSFIEWLRTQSPSQETHDSIDKYIFKSFGFVRN
ncbi:U27-like protein [Lissonota sp. PSUC_FEM 10030012]|nr:U27-like protein [Lissonota sp. PSUC_FEM 10030012]